MDNMDTTPAVDIASAVPFAAHLGIELLEASPDRVRLRAAWQERYCTSFGLLHGGFLMTLADTAGAVAASLHLPDGAGTTTLESKTNFLRGVREGELVATATPMHTGRTSIVIATDIHDAAGRLVAHTTQTQLVLPGAVG